MPRTLIAVTIYVHPEREQAFRKYEERALVVGARYDCVLLHAARLSKRATGTEAPFEFHLLSLPNDAALRSWQEDGEYRALAAERRRCIARFDFQMGLECTELLREIARSP
jgi:hypothetical protein